jgi:hypothetical protein
MEQLREQMALWEKAMWMGILRPDQPAKFNNKPLIWVI